MCGRYWIDDGRESVVLRGIIEVVNCRVVVETVKTSGEIFPADIVHIVASNKSMVPAAFAMRWGYTLPDGRHIINARSETAETKPMFADGMCQRRCAVPATRYFEWEKAGKAKTKYAIRPTDGALFFMAGIYRFESGRPVFSILTREPADNIAFIHNRMPVILPHDLVKDWTNPSYRAGEILNHAVLDLSHEWAEETEQIRVIS